MYSSAVAVLWSSRKKCVNTTHDMCLISQQINQLTHHSFISIETFLTSSCLHLIRFINLMLPLIDKPLTMNDFSRGQFCTHDYELITFFLLGFTSSQRQHNHTWQQRWRFSTENVKNGEFPMTWMKMVKFETGMMHREKRVNHTHFPLRR